MDEVGLGADSPVELMVENGRLVVTAAHHFDLDDLLAGITDENRHDLVDWGEPVGTEAW